MNGLVFSIGILKHPLLMQFLEDAEHMDSLNQANFLEWVKITFRNWERVLESQIRKYVKSRIEIRAH